MCCLFVGKTCHLRHAMCHVRHTSHDMCDNRKSCPGPCNTETALRSSRLAYSMSLWLWGPKTVLSQLVNFSNADLNQLITMF